MRLPPMEASDEGEALESPGIAFISADDEGGPGIRFREVSSRASQ